MKYGIDFVITNKLYTYKKEHDLASIQILTGNYKDAEFTFGAIKVEENEGKNTASISFDYTVHSDPLLEGNENFEEVLGQIMNSLLEYSLIEAERQKQYNDEHRKENNVPTQEENQVGDIPQKK